MRRVADIGDGGAAGGGAAAIGVGRRGCAASTIRSVRCELSSSKRLVVRACYRPY